MKDIPIHPLLVPIVVPFCYLVMLPAVLIFHVGRFILCWPFIIPIGAIHGIVNVALAFERWFKKTYIEGEEVINDG